MAAMVTVLATGIGLAVVGVREVQAARGRRAFRRRLRALQEDAASAAMQARIRGVVAD